MTGAEQGDRIALALVLALMQQRTLIHIIQTHRGTYNALAVATLLCVLVADEQECGFVTASQKDPTIALYRKSAEIMLFRWHGMLCCGVLLLLLILSRIPTLQGWKTSSTTSITIAPPRSSREWKQMAVMLVGTFDGYGGGGVWEFRDRRATEQFVLKQYVDTARRMKGNKYTLLVAKSSSRNVVGMVEMGLSRDAERNETRATIGVLCVSPKCQRSGVGSLLLDKCQALATSKGWNEMIIYAEVEPSNEVALSFFEKHGFVRNGKNRTVTVRRRRLDEARLHLLLSKELTPSEP